MLLVEENEEKYEIRVSKNDQNKFVKSSFLIDYSKQDGWTITSNGQSVARIKGAINSANKLAFYRPISEGMNLIIGNQIFLFSKDELKKV